MTDEARFTALEDNYSRLEKQWGETQEDVNQIGLKVSAMESTNALILNSVRALEKKADRPPEKFNLIGWISTAGLVLVLCGGFIQLRLAPLESADAALLNSLVSQDREYELLAQNVIKNHTNISHLKDRADRAIDLQHNVMEILTAIEVKASYQEAELNLLKEQVDTIDSGGSRRWVNGKGG